MRHGIAAAVALSMVLAGPAMATARVPVVAGSYSYGFTGHVTAVQLSARGGASPSGVIRAGNPYMSFSGVVGCVTAVGNEAWVAGRVTDGWAFDMDGWAVKLVDNGAKGAGGDRAITYIDTLDTVLAWCEARDTSWDEVAGPAPLIRGNLVVIAP
jgi:hypothetical protein